MTLTNKTLTLNKTYEILTPTGWSDFSGILKSSTTQKTQKIIFNDGNSINVTKNHKFLTKSGKTLLAYKSLKKYVLTKNGSKQVVKIKENLKSETVYDLSDVQKNNIYFTNNIASHNCHIAREFWQSVYPIVTASKTSKIFVASTPNGTDNLFFELYDGATKKANGWHAERVDWWEIPGRDVDWKINTIKNLGSEEIFAQEYGNCIGGNSTLTMNSNGKIKDITIKKLYDSLRIKKNNNLKVLTPTGYQYFSSIRKLNKPTIVFKTTNKRSIVTTLDHPFSIFGKVILAKDLKIGDILEGRNKKSLNIVSITAGKNVDVYDLLDVEGGHVYYANDILVHNCFHKTGESAVNDEQFEKMKAHIVSPLFVYEDGHYLVWDTYKSDHIYTIGVDVSEGVGRDASCIQVLDVTDLTNIEQVAVYHNQSISPAQFITKCNEIFEHWGCPPVAIERNSCGGQVVDTLKNIHGYANLISWGTTAGDKSYNRLGIWAHTNTKYKGIVNFNYYKNDVCALKVRDIHTLKELKDFVRYPNGTWGARQGNGMFDDRVMSFVWALIILENDVATKYYDVEYDKNRRPVKLFLTDYGIERKFTDPQQTLVNLKESNRGIETIPTIINPFDNFEKDESLEELQKEGWKLYTDQSSSYYGSFM